MLINPLNLIVCQSHKQTIKQKALGVLLRILFWGAFVYVFCTFVALCSGLAGFPLFKSIIDYEDIDAIKVVLARYFPVIGVFVCVFLLWALYNKLRFQGARDRRKTSPLPVSLNETMEFCKLGADDILGMRQAKVMVCMFDDDGNIIGVKSGVKTLSVEKEQDTQGTLLVENAVLAEVNKVGKPVRSSIL